MERPTNDLYTILAIADSVTSGELDTSISRLTEFCIENCFDAKKNKTIIKQKGKLQ